MRCPWSRHGCSMLLIILLCSTIQCFSGDALTLLRTKQHASDRKLTILLYVSYICSPLHIAASISCGKVGSRAECLFRIMLQHWSKVGVLRKGSGTRSNACLQYAYFLNMCSRAFNLYIMVAIARHSYAGMLQTSPNPGKLQRMMLRGKNISLTKTICSNLVPC